MDHFGGKIDCRAASSRPVKVVIDLKSIHGDQRILAGTAKDGDAKRSIHDALRCGRNRDAGLKARQLNITAPVRRNVFDALLLDHAFHGMTFIVDGRGGRIHFDDLGSLAQAELHIGGRVSACLDLGIAR